MGTLNKVTYTNFQIPISINTMQFAIDDINLR